MARARALSPVRRWSEFPSADRRARMRASLVRVAAGPRTGCSRSEDSTDRFGSLEITGSRGATSSAYLGYRIDPCAGTGLLPGAPLVLRYAFPDARLHRVEAHIEPGTSAIALSCGGFTP